MAMCTLDGNAKETAQTASEMYAKLLNGDGDAAINFPNVMHGVNYNTECDDGNIDGHDKFVQDVYKELSGPLASAAVLGFGTRPGYPQIDREETVAEIHVPILDFGNSAKR